MIRAQIMTRWTGAGTESDSFRPKISDDFPEAFVTDEPTSQPAENLPTSPYIVIVEVVCIEAVYAAILAHAGYSDGAVLIDKAITEAEWETLRRIPYKDWPAI